MMGRVSPSHAPRRALVVFADVAEAQAAKLSDAELRAVDRAIVVISLNPGVGDQVGDGPLIEYRSDDGARILYYATALNTVVVVAYLEA